MFKLERINDQQYVIKKHGTKIATITDSIVSEIKRVDELAPYIARAMAREIVMTAEEIEALIKTLREEEC